MPVETSFLGAKLVILVAVSGKANKNGSREKGPLAEPPWDRIAIHAGKANIAKDELG